MDVARVGGLELFAGVPDLDLLAAIGAARRLSLAPGQTLLREGEPGRDVLLVLDGEAVVTVGGLAVGTIQPGDCVGEMSLLDDSPRSATVTSSSALVALVVPAERFRALLDSHPEVAQRLTSALTARLRHAQTGWACLAGDPDVLLASLLDLQGSADPVLAERARRQAASLVVRAAADAAVAAARTKAPSDDLSALTPSERRVAELVAQGLSNPAIGEKLHVSRHTVDTHVKHALAKFGIRSRVELAAVVLRSRAQG